MITTSVRLQEGLEGSLESLRWQETLTALESVQSGRTIPGEYVNAWLASWGQPGETKPR
jgi:hypothetical protein